MDDITKRFQHLLRPKLIDSGNGCRTIVTNGGQFRVLIKAPLVSKPKKKRKPKK